MSIDWFALRTKPRAEKVVAEALHAKGYEEFLPLHHERRRWSDRVASVEVPLFPGYVFCRFDARERLPILKTPGVLVIVGAGRQPEPVDEAEIASLQAVVGSRLPVNPWPYLYAGQKVRIVGGPLAGAEGILLSAKSRQRLVVSVTLLQRAVSVELPEHAIWPIEERR